jgi:hypothetical protein
MHTQYLKIEDIEFLKMVYASKSLKNELLGKLRLLPQIHQNSNLDKE